MVEISIFNNLKICKKKLNIGKELKTGNLNSLSYDSVFSEDFNNNYISINIKKEKNIYFNDEINGIEISFPVWIYFKFVSKNNIDSIEKYNDILYIKIPIEEVYDWAMKINNSNEYKEDINIEINEW